MIEPLKGQKVMKRYTVLITLLLAVACTPSGPRADELMPDLEGYNVIEGKDLTDAISHTAAGASMLTGNPIMAGVVEAVDGVMQCYQDAGAVSGRIFSQASDPLAAGVIVIIDRNRSLSFETLRECLFPSGPERAEAAVIQPCGNAYRLQRDNNEYYILYAATQPHVCQTFCANLEGCTQ